jgi:hypothetical protein
MLASEFLVLPNSQSCATSEFSISNEGGTQVTNRSLNFFSSLRLFFRFDLGPIYFYFSAGFYNRKAEKAKAETNNKIFNNF